MRHVATRLVMYASQQLLTELEYGCDAYGALRSRKDPDPTSFLRSIEQVRQLIRKELGVPQWRIESNPGPQNALLRSSGLIGS